MRVARPRRVAVPCPQGAGIDAVALASLIPAKALWQYAKDSFAYAHKAFAGITDTNATASIPAPWGKGTVTRLGLATLTVAHGFDHYGQMAVYLRMNGIIPPASRKP